MILKIKSFSIQYWGFAKRIIKAIMSGLNDDLIFFILNKWYNTIKEKIISVEVYLHRKENPNIIPDKISRYLIFE